MHPNIKHVPRPRNQIAKLQENKEGVNKLKPTPTKISTAPKRISSEKKNYWK